MLQRKRKQNKGMAPQFLSILDTGYLRAVDFFYERRSYDECWTS